jgi:hypothetical protein
MIPFSLRIIKAALPYLTGADKSLDQMFELIAVSVARVVAFAA